MADIHEKETDAGISIGAPGGWWAKLHGKQIWLLILVFVFAITALDTYQTWTQHTIRKEEHQKITEGQAKVETAIQGLKDAQTETTYVLTLTQDRREKLNLQIPDSLRRKINSAP